MKDFRALLALPASLLSVMLATQVGAQELAWGDVGLRLADRNDIYRRRDSEIEQQPARQAPAGVRKMSDDEGEKFFFHYWDLGDELAHSNASSTLFPASRPLAAHSNNSRTPIALFGRSIFARDFQCPADTSSCSAAGNADLCCPTGQDCATVAGSICCCPPGETCTDSCAACNTAAGYTSCPNGGCCVPGAVCAGTGCVFYGTATTVVTLSTTSASPIVSSTTTTVQAPFTTQQPPVVVTTVQPSVLVSGYTTTVTVTESASGGATTIVSPTTVIIAPAATITSDTSVSAASQPSSICNVGLTSCPATLGGGCCPSGQACATNNLCGTATTSPNIAGGAPILPTSVSPAETSVSAASVAPSSTVTTDASCPTGFYQCSAYYMGGCCRVGRNCDTTSCPSTDSTAVVSSGATVVVPYTSTTVVGSSGTVAAAAAETQGSCANGWFTCAASASGGCCPSGHVCGAVSCTATVSGQSDTGKVAPSGAGVVGCAWGFLVLAVGSGIGMVWL
ncbi:hypothetical protein LTR91_008093 [Friedmanniomyces endolithicus]|uniref:GPI anchored protein n=1 Tax=Friedmanniomyces endolithicus TaxID=329885 RepID=A0AAN6KMV4_9PEZI|nr:hypothetical protein LTR59_016096 [Friedmanniomyces endolithicus]KAK0807631.1 hypothetical protein LTR38_004853 [Friedmanniomyces endolithicus]KAK0816952.1 hypothetical protein LTR75_003305 [Friedmanniomyces endolithicus]KAK0831143.1 hypothetical protein LTR03_015681 [Friedmanniomyces endolithicus]KAK0845093.1 hypothetical protein LTS02_015431 [Friedmanniomyces endolithicus]